MIRHRYAAAALILAAAILIFFLLSAPHTTETPVASHQAVPAATLPTVTVHDSYKKGTHTLSGSIQAPDACANVSATASLTGTASSSQSIAIALDMPATVGTCLEVPTTLSWKAALVAPAELPITVTVNGANASSTLQ